MDKTKMALLGAAGIVLVGVLISLVVGIGPDTAPVEGPERTDTVQDLPAGRAAGNDQPGIDNNPQQPGTN
jgi:hypothetical protein